MSYKDTPLMKQYQQIKNTYPDSILLFRMGDFYETFNNDAIKISEILNITLTARDKNNDPTPLAGFPYHALNTYLPKLVNANLKVVIAEQIEDPKIAKGIVKRKVTQVVSPGTKYQDILMDEDKNSYLASVSLIDEIYSFAYVDISTGEFWVTCNSNIKSIEEEINKIKPNEIILSKNISLNISEKILKQFLLVSSEESRIEIIKDVYKVDNLISINIDENKATIESIYIILKYLKENHNDSLKHLKLPFHYPIGEYMFLNEVTIRSLELFESKNIDNSLFKLLDSTKTPMGKRLLRNWILHPLMNKHEINSRYEYVKYYLNEISKCEIFTREMNKIGDVERNYGRLGLKKISPRDLKILGMQLVKMLRVLNEAGYKDFKINEVFSNRINELIELIENSIEDTVISNFNEKYYVKKEYNQEIFKYRDILEGANDKLKEYEHEEQNKSHIPTLRIKYNQVVGYFIEVTPKYKDIIPEYYQIKQTLTTALRYTTPELKKFEDKIIDAEINLLKYQENIYTEIIDKSCGYLNELSECLDKIKKLDVIISFSQNARQFNYCKPKISIKDNYLSIKNGRHPILDKKLGNRYIPNSVLFADDNILHIITGPNMSGKSTYLRQNALLIILAQIGSYVPAESMEYSIVDKIFTRIGSADDISEGKSTFMVEMSELSYILNNATSNSLIILDEIGRGTGTYDGISIATAVIKYITSKLKAKTLFATHYHELTDLTEVISNIKNYYIEVDDTNSEDLIFLYNVNEGISNKSYGISVAKMAGIKSEVIEEAQKVHSKYEYHTKQIKQNIHKTNISLFNKINLSEKELKISKIIKEIKIESTTPIDALTYLNKIIKIWNSK